MKIVLTRRALLPRRKLDTRIHAVRGDLETTILTALTRDRCVRARKADGYVGAGGSWAFAVAGYAELRGVPLDKGFDAQVSGVVHEGEVGDGGGVGHVGAAMDGEEVCFLGSGKGC